MTPDLLQLRMLFGRMDVDRADLVDHIEVLMQATAFALISQ